jgi:hypothetical protein
MRGNGLNISLVLQEPFAASQIARQLPKIPFNISMMAELEKKFNTCFFEKWLFCRINQII